MKRRRIRDLIRFTVALTSELNVALICGAALRQKGKVEFATLIIERWLEQNASIADLTEAMTLEAARLSEEGEPATVESLTEFYRESSTARVKGPKQSKERRFTVSLTDYYYERLVRAAGLRGLNRMSLVYTIIQDWASENCPQIRQELGMVAANDGKSLEELEQECLAIAKRSARESRAIGKAIDRDPEEITPEEEPEDLEAEVATRFRTALSSYYNQKLICNAGIRDKSKLQQAAWIIERWLDENDQVIQSEIESEARTRDLSVETLKQEIERIATETRLASVEATGVEKPRRFSIRLSPVYALRLAWSSGLRGVSRGQHAGRIIEQWIDRQNTLLNADMEHEVARQGVDLPTLTRFFLGDAKRFARANRAQGKPIDQV